MEMPARSDAGAFYTHNDLQLGGKTVRNWSFLWDASNKVSLWVAYPLYGSILEANVDRTDAWGYDPLLSSSQQPDVTSTYTGSSSYARGHQLPSADRQSSYAANASTFYSTNMTPQCHDFNNNLWAQLESQVRYWAKGCDTLYVVTGCIVEGSTRSTTDRNTGMRITVPTHYYKALLRLKNGSYTSCAYIYDHFAYLDGELSADTFDMSARVSVAEVEKKTGMTFFANLSAKVGESQAQLIKATASSW